MTKSYYYSRYYKVPGTTVGILSLPSKMPGYGWGMTAKISCPYAVTGPGAICNSCYATKGRYVFGDVANAYRQRFAWARRCMRSEDGQQEFIELLVRAIRKTATTYFRVHDSGDLFSPVYTRCWIAICKALPDVRFWFPTRSYQAPWLDVIRELASLPNVAVRPSALHFNAPAPVIAGLAAGSSAGATPTCPAYRQGNACQDCRVCWDAKTQPVTYLAH